MRWGPITAERILVYVLFAGSIIAGIAFLLFMAALLDVSGKRDGWLYLIVCFLTYVIWAGHISSDNFLHKLDHLPPAKRVLFLLPLLLASYALVVVVAGVLSGLVEWGRASWLPGLRGDSLWLLLPVSALTVAGSLATAFRLARLWGVDAREDTRGMSAADSFWRFVSPLPETQRKPAATAQPRPTAAAQPEAPAAAPSKTAAAAQPKPATAAQPKPISAPSRPPLRFSFEQEQQIKKRIANEHVQNAGDFDLRLAVGFRLPPHIPIEDLPAAIAEIDRRLAGYKCTIVSRVFLIVEPAGREIVAMISV
jgi:hypothetical protein